MGDGCGVGGPDLGVTREVPYKQQLKAQQSERTHIKYGFDHVITGVCSS